MMLAMPMVYEPTHRAELVGVAWFGHGPARPERRRARGGFGPDQSRPAALTYTEITAAVAQLDLDEADLEDLLSSRDAGRSRSAPP
jgi:hypothetical protein